MNNPNLTPTNDPALALQQLRCWIKTLAQLDQELIAIQAPQAMMEIITRRVRQDLQTERAWLWLLPVSESGDSQPIRYPSPVEGGTELSDEYLLQVIQAFNANNLDSPAALSRHLELGSPTDGSCRRASPLVLDGAAIGALIVERQEPFDEDASAYLDLLVGRAAAAIRSARLSQQVQQAIQAKNKFVSVVTHELRIPMTSIKGYADLMKAGVVGPLNEQQMNFIVVIRNNVERMNALVSDLSDISKIETGRLRIECSHIPPARCIEDTADAFRTRLEEKKLSLAIEVPSDLPEVYADHNRVVQILSNLLNNAWRYTPSGGSIRVTATALPGEVCISVIDNGIGIRDEDQQRLFTQFFRSENPAVREEPGWGLGLAVSRALAGEMGGSMGHESTYGKGSTFWLTLSTEENRCRST